MKARELVKIARENGWTFDRQGKGSHEIYAHPEYQWIVSIPMHGSKDVPTGTAAAIVKDIKGRK